MENFKYAYNNNKFKISAPTWNDKFDLPDGPYSVSDIQDYFEYMNKKHETIADNPHVQIYTNEMFLSYKLELLPPETMKLLGSTKKILIKIRNERIFQN